MTVATDPREALIRRRSEISQDAEDGLVTAVAELAGIDARIAELDRRPEPLDVAGVFAALDEVAPPKAKQVENEERIALARRRQALAPELLAGDEAAKAELAKVEARLAELDRQAEFETLAAAEVADRARIAAEAEAEKKRAAAARKIKAIDGQRNKKLSAIETAIDDLIYAITDWGDIELTYDDLRKQIDPEANRRRFMGVVADRLWRRLREIGLHELDMPYGTRGLARLGSEES